LFLVKLSTTQEGANCAKTGKIKGYNWKYKFIPMKILRHMGYVMIIGLPGAVFA
jgi:hypothetical protein